MKHTLFQASFKTISILLIISIFLSSMNIVPVVARAVREPAPQGLSLETTQADNEPLNQEPAKQIIEPTIFLHLDDEIVTALDVTAAGTGSYYRARVTLKHPADLARLQDWGMTILDSTPDYAYVQVEREELAILAK